jgi:aromatic-L-amino-acid/L-tryptophan decarboxylase
MSLDPDDWEELRALGHRMIDRLIDRHREIDREKAYRQPSQKNAMQRPLPEAGAGFEQAYQDFLKMVEPSATGNAHPRFFGWAMGSGTTFGAFAQMLASGTAINAFGGEQAATYVELELFGWLKALLSQPSDASGILTSGASIANLYALYVAREKHPDRRRVHASEAVHASIDRACRLLDLELSHGEPDEGSLAIVGTAGTVMTGAFEDLERLANTAKTLGAWFHVDAAIGIGCALAPSLQARLRGIEHADSVAFDLHKWLQIGPGTGGLIVRDPKAHEAAFRRPSPYLGAVRGGLGGSKRWFHLLGLEHTRRFLALEPWMVLLAYGTQRLGQIVEHSVGLAQKFAALIDERSELERLAEVPLNIVLFRHRTAGNDRILADLAQRGIAILSPGRIGDTFALRAAFFGHRTAEGDLSETIDQVIAAGR